MMARWFITLGALNGLAAIGLGAFGAHGLKQILDASAMATYHTAADYHIVHALALLGTGLYARLSTCSYAITVAGWGFVVGMLLFSGSLYLLVLTKVTTLGMVTPVGGLTLILAWGALALAAWTEKTT